MIQSDEWIRFNDPQCFLVDLGKFMNNQKKVNGPRNGE